MQFLVRKINQVRLTTVRQQRRRVQLMKNKSQYRKNPVKKNMDKFHKPVTHIDKKKEEKKNPPKVLIDDDNDKDWVEWWK